MRAVTNQRRLQTVAAALNAVKSGKHVVVIDVLDDPQALADAVVEAAEREGRPVLYP
jgi:hypothetical protein